MSLPGRFAIDPACQQQVFNSLRREFPQALSFRPGLAQRRDTFVNSGSWPVETRAAIVLRCSFALAPPFSNASTTSGVAPLCRSQACP